MELPNIKDNYLKDLSFYTDTLFRETDPSGAIHLIDPNAGGEIGETYLSNTRDLAKGQGSNKGLLLEFNSKGLSGQLNRNKPGWDFAYKQGGTEFIAKNNPKNAYLNNIKSVTILDPKVLKSTYGSRLLKMFQDGWIKNVDNNGVITFTKKAMPMASRILMGLDPWFAVSDMLKLQGAYPYSQKEMQQIYKDLNIPMVNGKPVF